ncbi:MAG: recombinase family protein [Blautia sp.]|nr:recombinase family protein [Blautia sp.]
MTGTAKKIYSAGIYARLSVDSGEKKNESIETQLEIAKAFIARQEDIVLYNCYTDIGRTGTDFDREGFERMMCDVRARRIDCVVVKDLSRFGRNHIETGNYIEKIFPFMGVRFIAVTDQFDSMDPSGQTDALGMNLKNLVNEMYARDIAIKVRSSKKAKWEQGGYTGGIPPYGYRAERTGDKKCLVVEEETADIVRKIYELFLSGKNMKEIARWLYESRILRPERYRRTGQVRCPEPERLEQWPRCTLKRILTNPVYMGCLVQGWACGKDCRMRNRHDIDSGSRSVREHAHEAIIGEEQFFEAAAKFGESAKYCNKSGRSKNVSPDEDIFADVLCCGVCGAKMKRISAAGKFHEEGGSRLYGYRCPKADRIDGFRCTGNYVTLCALTDIVKKAVCQEFSLSGMRPEELTAYSGREAEAAKGEWSRKLSDLERKMEMRKKLGSEQYYRYRTGELDEARFQQAKKENDKKSAFIQMESAAMKEKLREIEIRTAEKNHFLRALAAGDEKCALTADAVKTLTDRIEIYPDHRVKLLFSFQRNGLPAGKEENGNERISDRRLPPPVQGRGRERKHRHAAGASANLCGGKF